MLESSTTDAANIAVQRLALIQLLDFVEACKVQEPSDSSKNIKTDDAENTEDIKECSCGCVVCASRLWIGDSKNQLSGPLILADGNSDIWDLIKEISRTGVCTLPWPFFKVALAATISAAFDTMAVTQAKHIRLFDWQRARNYLIQEIFAFTLPPFTLQRLCEVALHPLPNNIEKFYFALRKILAVRDIGENTACSIQMENALKERFQKCESHVDALESAALRMPGARVGAYQIYPCPSANIPNSCCSTCSLCSDWMNDILCNDEDIYGSTSGLAGTSSGHLTPCTETAFTCEEPDLVNHTMFDADSAISHNEFSKDDVPIEGDRNTASDETTDSVEEACPEDIETNEQEMGNSHKRLKTSSDEETMNSKDSNPNE